MDPRHDVSETDKLARGGTENGAGTASELRLGSGVVGRDGLVVTPRTGMILERTTGVKRVDMA